MRILHTSDWHVGRQFFGLSLEDDHAAILDQVEKAIVDHKPDVLIIAGDIFDRVAPPASAVRQFNGFVKRVASRTQTTIIIIAGNHDSGDRIGTLGVLATSGRALICGPLDPLIEPLLLEDEGGTVAFSALAFGYEYAARECFERDDIDCPADVLAAQIAAARAHVPPGARWVVTAHAFVEGGSISESERALGRTVGGIETVPASLFHGAHYVALGHLHRPQEAGGKHIRYSGSPIAFGFDEGGHEKSMTLVELAADGSIETKTLPFSPKRRVRTLRGKLTELLAGDERSEDFVKVVLTDEMPQIEPMKRIRERYPNAVQLLYEKDETPLEVELTERQKGPADPQDVINGFVAAFRSDPMTNAEKSLVLAALNTVSTEEGAE